MKLWIGLVRCGLFLDSQLWMCHRMATVCILPLPLPHQLSISTDYCESETKSAGIRAQEIRSQLANFIRCNPEMVDGVLDTKLSTEQQNSGSIFKNISLNQYLSDMEKNHSWGDGIVLAAASVCYSRSVVVFLIDRDTPIVFENNNATCGPIYLGYVNYSSHEKNHYVSLLKNEDYNKSREEINWIVHNATFAEANTGPTGRLPENQASEPTMSGEFVDKERRLASNPTDKINKTEKRTISKNTDTVKLDNNVSSHNKKKIK